MWRLHQLGIGVLRNEGWVAEFHPAHTFERLHALLGLIPNICPLVLLSMMSMLISPWPHIIDPLLQCILLVLQLPTTLATRCQRCWCAV